MEKEIWKDIAGYEGLYQASNLGNIKSLPRFDKRGCPIKEKILKSGIGCCKHHNVSLHKNGKGRTIQVSVIIAKAFPEICGEYFDGCHIHHKDHNPENNAADNLQVLTMSDHMVMHKGECSFPSSAKPVYQYTYNWEFITMFDSSIAAAESVNGDVHALRTAINKRDSHYYKGYRWLWA